MFRLHFSECLRARKHVYAFSQGQHLEVSTVLHELGCVAFAQGRIAKANEMLRDEKAILDQLNVTMQSERLFHARMTNLTWLRKCAKGMGDEEEVRQITSQRTHLKKQNKLKACQTQQVGSLPLQRAALSCRSVARQYALANTGKKELDVALASLGREIEKAHSSFMKEAAWTFYRTISEALAQNNMERHAAILEACDDLR
jgi:hypothetical protein